MRPNQDGAILQLPLPIRSSMLIFLPALNKARLESAFEITWLEQYPFVGDDLHYLADFWGSRRFPHSLRTTLTGRHQLCTMAVLYFERRLSSWCQWQILGNGGGKLVCRMITISNCTPLTHVCACIAAYQSSSLRVECSWWAAPLLAIRYGGRIILIEHTLWVVARVPPVKTRNTMWTMCYCTLSRTSSTVRWYSLTCSTWNCANQRSPAASLWTWSLYVKSELCVAVAIYGAGSYCEVCPKAYRRIWCPLPRSRSLHVVLETRQILEGAVSVPSAIRVGKDRGQTVTLGMLRGH